MGDVFMAICKYLGQSIIMKLSVYVTLDDVRNFLEETWPGSIVNGGLLTYSLPGNEHCLLKSEDDYQNLWIMQGILNLKHIDISIQDTSGEGCSSNRKSSDSMSSHVTNAVTIYGDDIGMDVEEDDMQVDIPVLLTDVWKGLIQGVGQEFAGGAVMFREALQKFSIKHGFNYRFLKNERQRVTAVCMHRASLDCLWRIHATSDSSGQFFYIREYIAEHSCVIGVQPRTSNRMSSTIVAKEIQHHIERFPLTKPTDVVKDFALKYGLEISYDLSYLGVEKARATHFGNYKISFEQLMLYLERSMLCNPGSHMVFKKDEVDNRFKRAFVSYYACIVGFNFCRPIIFLDATFLSGRFKGQLLCATTKDGNNNLFPIAYGIVDLENEDNWTWFLRELRVILNEERVIVFVSDRHKGLLQSVSTTFPGHPHSFCTIHLKANLKTKLSGKPDDVKKSIAKKFNQVSYSYTISRFARKYAELKMSVGDEVSTWLDTIPPHNYSHAYFPGKRYEEMTSNAAESLNAKYVKIRQLPVYGLVDGIHTMLMNDMTAKREASLNYKGLFTPSISEKIKTGIEFGMSWIVHRSSDFVFEVRAKKSVSVDLLLKTCSCHFWQTNSFPCAHAFAAIHRSKLDLASFIDTYYHNATNQMVYNLPIIPVDTVDMPVVNPTDLQVLSPKCKRQPGRPKRKRGLGATDDSTRPYQCGRCKGFNHNSRTCQEEAQD